MKNLEKKMVEGAFARLAEVSPERLAELRDRCIARLQEINAPKILMEYPSPQTLDAHIESYNFNVLKRSTSEAVLYIIGTIEDVNEDIEPFATDNFAAFHPQYKYEHAYLVEGDRAIWMGRLTLKD